MASSSPALPLSPDAADLFPGPLVLLDRAHRLIFANKMAADLFTEPRLGLPLELFARWPAIREAADFLSAGGEHGQFALHLPVPVPRHFIIHARRAGAYFLLFLEETTQILKSQQLRSEFIADASHELKTPLAVLLAGLDEIAEEQDASQRRQISALLGKQAVRMARLVDRLISLARIEAREHNPPQSAVDILVIAREAVALMAKRAEAKNTAIRLDCVENLPPVFGDGEELTQLFFNLIENALIHGRNPKDGEVVIVLKPLSGGVLLEVCDNGSGIAAEHLPRLTERFYRAVKKEGGAGLGLAIVKHILARHRAELKVESQPGEGAKFAACLPAAPNPLS